MSEQSPKAAADAGSHASPAGARFSTGALNRSVNMPWWCSPINSYCGASVEAGGSSGRDGVGIATAAFTITRRPFHEGSTPGPTASTTPQASHPLTLG